MEAPVPHVGLDRPLPQERLARLALAHPEARRNATLGAFRLEGELDRDALAQSLATIAGRHEIPTRLRFARRRRREARERVRDLRGQALALCVLA